MEKKRERMFLRMGLLLCDRSPVWATNVHWDLDRHYWWLSVNGDCFIGGDIYLARWAKPQISKSIQTFVNTIGFFCKFRTVSFLARTKDLYIISFTIVHSTFTGFTSFTSLSQFNSFTLFTQFYSGGFTHFTGFNGITLRASFFFGRWWKDYLVKLPSSWWTSITWWKIRFMRTVMLKVMLSH